MARFEVGACVKARFQGGNFFPGVVRKVRDDGTCDIAYDDGDKEKKVPLRYIRPLEEDSDVYTAEHIMDMRYSSSSGKEYRVRWAGWSEADDTWEPRENILDQKLLREFAKRKGVELSEDEDEDEDEDEEEEEEEEGGGDDGDADGNGEDEGNDEDEDMDEGASEGEGKGTGVGEVQKIEAVRTVKGGGFEYLVHWLGGGETTWEPVANFPVEECEQAAAFWRLKGETPPAVAHAPPRVPVSHIEAMRMVKGGALQYLVHLVGGGDAMWEPASDHPVESSAPARAFWQGRGEEPPAAAHDTRAAAAAEKAVAKAAAKAAVEQAAAEKTAKKAAAERVAEERATAEKAAAMRLAKAKAAAEKAAAEKAAAEKLAAERAAADKAATEEVAAKAAIAKAASDKAAAEKAGIAPATASSSTTSSSSACAAWVGRLPGSWRLGAIIGGTASGKTRALAQLSAAGLVTSAAEPSDPSRAWPSDLSIISAIADSDAVTAAAAAGTLAAHVDGASPLAEVCAELATDRLGAVGLNSLPVWLRPYAALSNGQRARADVARSLESGLAIDDFGATVDARNASVCAAGVARSVRRRDLDHVVLASVHQELLQWMGACWAYFPATDEVLINPSPGGKPQVSLRYDEAVTDAQFTAVLPKATKHPVIARAELRTAASSLVVQKPKLLRSSVRVDAACLEAARAFQYKFDGTGEPFAEPVLPQRPAGWCIGLLMGSSGSGKSTVLRALAAECVKSHGRPPRDAARLGGEGEPPEVTAWPADAPAISALPLAQPAADALLTRFGGAALAAAAARRPFCALSRGERTMLAAARLCVDANAAVGEGCSASHANGGGLTIIDEFTSFVDRPTAACAAAATRASWIGHRGGTGECLVCASVHDDVLPYLRPDWVYDTKARKLTAYRWAEQDLDENAVRAIAEGEAAASRAAAGAPSGGGGDCAAGSAVGPFAPPVIEVVVRQTMPQASELNERSGGPALSSSHVPDGGANAAYKTKMWTLFKEHHYMSGELSTSSVVSIARWGRLPIGFIAVMPQPGKLIKHDPRIKYREHRLVVLPEYQGIGVGTRLSAVTGARFIARGNRYYSKSASSVLRNHRRMSPLWLEAQTQANSKAHGTMGETLRERKKTSNPRGAQVRAVREAPKHAGEAKEQEGLFSFEYIGTDSEQICSHYLARGGELAAYVPPRSPEEHAHALRAAQEFLRPVGQIGEMGEVGGDEDGGEDGDEVASSSSAAAKRRAPTKRAATSRPDANLPPAKRAVTIDGMLQEPAEPTDCAPPTVPPPAVPRPLPAAVLPPPTTAPSAKPAGLGIAAFFRPQNGSGGGKSPLSAGLATSPFTAAAATSERGSASSAASTPPVPPLAPRLAGFSGSASASASKSRPGKPKMCKGGVK